MYTGSRIAIAVQGRFHAIELAQALVRHGAQPHIFSNYPAWALLRLGYPTQCGITSFWRHGILTRLMAKTLGAQAGEAALHQMFGRWAARSIDAVRFDAVHLWSGIAEETLQTLRKKPRSPLLTIMRGSAHIRTQDEILLAEEQRAQIRIDRPSAWMIAREEREYDLTDMIVCLSNFARNSFVERGFASERITVAPLGVNTARFLLSPESLTKRSERILRREPLRVLTVGGFSFQKGIYDYARVVEKFPGQFRFVGAVSPEGRSLARSLESKVDFIGRIPQTELAQHFAWADLFFFPTLQDGFASVLTQAAAAGLPILTTTNCSGPDLVQHGVTGWIAPIREPETLLQHLTWCDGHREDLSHMAATVAQAGQPQGWDRTASILLRTWIARTAAK